MEKHEELNVLIRELVEDTLDSLMNVPPKKSHSLSKLSLSLKIKENNLNTTEINNIQNDYDQKMPYEINCLDDENNCETKNNNYKENLKIDSYFCDNSMNRNLSSSFNISPAIVDNNSNELRSKLHLKFNINLNETKEENYISLLKDDNFTNSELNKNNKNFELTSFENTELFRKINNGLANGININSDTKDNENKDANQSSEIEEKDLSFGSENDMIESLESKSLLKTYLEKCRTTKLHPGDLVWAGIRGYPFWPSMITVDPQTGVHEQLRGAKTINGKPKNLMLYYYVRFFGDYTRSYVGCRYLLLYEGKTFFEAVSQQIDADKRLKKEWHSYFNIPLRFRYKWLKGIKELEDYLYLDCDSRLQEFEKRHNAIVSRNLKKTASVITESQSLNKNLEKDVLKDLPNDQLKKSKEERTSLSKYDKNESPSKNHSRTCCESSFRSFMEKYFDDYRESNPELSEKNIRKMLQKRWHNMKEYQRARYKSRKELMYKSGDDNSQMISDGISENMETDKEDFKKIKSFNKNSLPLKDFNKDILKDVQNKEHNDKSSSMNGEIDLTEKELKNSKKFCKEKSVKKNESIRSDNESVSSEEQVQKSRTKNYLKGDKPCLLCEKVNGNAIYKCIGSCHGVFHVECGNMEQIGEAGYKCFACRSGQFNCSVCRKKEGSLLKCKIATCNKYYHKNCLRLFPQARFNSDSIICPLHMCHMCASDNPKDPPPAARCNIKRLLKCLRCPSAYHPSDRCLPAGSTIVSGGYIICPKHYSPPRKNQAHISAGWCFICSKGGSLICCDNCPASFHYECLKFHPPEGSFYCEDCESGRLPLYEDIIWVKVGSYRWWPAEVVHPCSVPVNILRLPHLPGEFPVRFFGSHDYYWSCQGKVFLYEEGDSNVKCKKTSTALAASFNAALEEAAQTFNIVMEKRNLLSIKQEAKNNHKPPPFVKIRSNRPIDVTMPECDLSKISQCDCNPEKGSSCGPDSNCLNRIMMIECHPNFCRAKDACQNQRFRKCQYPALEVFRTTDRGWGLRTLVSLNRGDFIIEYVGELITPDACTKRIAEYHASNEHNFYFLTLDKDRIIDAGPKGNLSRFINHSCNPNCETQKWTVSGDTRVGIFALCDIDANEELNFNYNLEAVGDDKKRCECKADNCSGFIGIKAKNCEPVREKRIKRKKIRLQRSFKQVEQECFLCGEVGELLVCNRKLCPKAYHLQCLQLSNIPNGQWECPWHYCDVCGQAVIIKCTHCSSSLCRRHNDGRIQYGGCLGYVCDEHDKNEIEQLKEILELQGLALNSSNLDDDSCEESEDSNSENSVDCSIPVESLSVPVKRKRGRPRKYPLPDVPYNMSIDEQQIIPEVFKNDEC